MFEFEKEDAKSRNPFYDEEEEGRREEERKRYSKDRTDARGLPLNINQARIDFHYDDSHPQEIAVELKLYKVMVMKGNMLTLTLEDLKESMIKVV
jgi:hypothetical protein